MFDECFSTRNVELIGSGSNEHKHRRRATRIRFDLTSSVELASKMMEGRKKEYEYGHEKNLPYRSMRTGIGHPNKATHSPMADLIE